MLTYTTLVKLPDGTLMAANTKANSTDEAKLLFEAEYGAEAIADEIYMLV